MLAHNFGQCRRRLGQHFQRISVSKQSKHLLAIDLGSRTVVFRVSTGHSFLLRVMLGETTIFETSLSDHASWLSSGGTVLIEKTSSNVEAARQLPASGACARHRVIVRRLCRPQLP